MLIQKFARFLNPISLYTVLNRSLKWNTIEQHKHFSEIFGITPSIANNYRFINKIPMQSKKELYGKAALFKTIGISTNEWLKYPILFKESYINLEQRYLLLKEGGFTDIDAQLLVDCRKLTRKKISLLKSHRVLDAHTNVAECFITHLSPRQENFPIDDFTDESIFADVHHKILTRFLIWRLKTTEDVIAKFYRIWSFKMLKSLAHICETLNYLESVGYTSKDILQNGVILRVTPTNLSELLEELPSLAGVDMRIATKMYPRLVRKSPSHYRQMYNLLKLFNIPDTSIQCNMDIFLMKPQTLRYRLQEISNIPELKVLFNSPGILRVIKRHNEARSRLSFLQSIKFKCLSTLLLYKKESMFNQQIREGKDVTFIKELVALLKSLLNSSSFLIENNLKKHRYCCHVPLLEIENACNYLKDTLKFSSEAIIDAIPIVLYPSNKIGQAYGNLPILKNKCLTQVEKLNLMLYLLEKDYHFTGNGIWTNYIENI